jgi:pimeloyl-ACP methyl ester carboxylesterase
MLTLIEHETSRSPASAESQVAAAHDGLPVVALHCSGSGAHQWKAWRAGAGPSARIITPALLGYAGLEPWDSRRRVGLGAEARVLAPLLNEHRDGVHLVGHSYGGAVAMEFALRYPQRVRSLTLYEPVRFSILREFGDPEWHEIVDIARSMVILAKSGSTEASSQHFVDYWSGSGSWTRLPNAARDAIRLRAAKMCAEFDALFDDETPLGQYQALTMPVTLLSGDRSPRPALQVTDRLSEMLPRAQCIRLLGLGHMGPVQAPERVMHASGLFQRTAQPIVN